LRRMLVGRGVAAMFDLARVGRVGRGATALFLLVLAAGSVVAMVQLVLVLGGMAALELARAVRQGVAAPVPIALFADVDMDDVAAIEPDAAERAHQRVPAHPRGELEC